jgi:phosphatidylinositol glycan class S
VNVSAFFYEEVLSRLLQLQAYPTIQYCISFSLSLRLYKGHLLYSMLMVNYYLLGFTFRIFNSFIGSPSPSTAFLVPQWGGIVIYNPPPETERHLRLSSAPLNPVFSSFSTQLLALLGVPKLPSSVRIVAADDSTPILTDWQLDALLRRRTLENVRGSQDTLLSIIKLVEQIGNMPVGRGVKDDVNGALTALEKVLAHILLPEPTILTCFPSQVYALSPTSLSLALRHSSHATTLASRAFFNPGMLALLYFPAEHKYAVYTPLFASAIIPLVGAAVRELITWWRRRKAHNGARQTDVKAVLSQEHNVKSE